MADGYSRQSAAEIQTGNVIQAASLNDEFDALLAFGNNTTGHNHDGTVGGGAKIPTAGLQNLTNISSGFVVADGVNAFLSRTLTGTANEITVTNGTGVSGNPTLSIPTAVTFTGKTITGGTFSSPTLTGTPIVDVLRTSGSSGIALQNSGGTTVLTVGSANTTNSTFAGAVNINGSEAVLSASNTQTVTNKTINLANNTLTGTTAQFNTALSDGDFATLAGTGTLTNKTINLANNTLTGTTAQFNTALSDGDFATLAGTETLTNKTINLANNTLTGTTAQFNTALSDGDFATLAGTETLTNKTINFANNTFVGSLSVANGGTGATTLTANNVILGNGTSAVQFVAPGTSGNVLTSNGTTWESTALSTSGTFTPTVFGTSSAGTATYSLQSGNYQRIANVVFYSLTIVWSGHTGTGNMRFGGLPFTSAAGSGPMAPVYYDGIAVGAGKSGIAQVLAGTATMAMYALDPAGSAAQVAVDAGGEINIAGFYFV